MCNEREDKGKIAKSYNEELNRKQRDERLNPHGYGTHSPSPRKPRITSNKNLSIESTISNGGHIKFTITPSKVTSKHSLLDLKVDALAVALEALELLINKHKDYGPTNISNAPGGALNGLNVRLHDKVARLGNLLASGKAPQHESIRDTFIDILNYSVIALLVIDNKWETK